MLFPVINPLFSGFWVTYIIWSGSMCDDHIALQELHLVVLSPHRMFFINLVRWLPYIWIIVLLKLIYMMKVVWCLSLSRLTWCILNLVTKQGITLIPAYIPTLLNVEVQYLLFAWYWGELWPDTSNISTARLYNLFYTAEQCIWWMYMLSPNKYSFTTSWHFNGIPRPLY